MSVKPRDIEIKLFGRTITSIFHLNHSVQSKEVSSSSSSSSSSPSLEQDTVLANKNEQDKSRFKDPYILSDLNERPKATSEISSPISTKNNVDQQSSEITTTTTTTSTSQNNKPTEVLLKKPDKILPCPRCESTNTKFCYYNNYNVNQPRYFCRNCQRYWTSGGSMRNVPVGSGRRKTKGWPSSNPYLQITSEDYHNSRTILSFGSLESETGNHQSVDTKVTTADSGSQEHKTRQGFLPPQVMFPNSSPPWPYQWNPTDPNANFYPATCYWGYTVPLWPTSETSPCLRKRSRDQTEVGTKDATPITRARLVSESLEVNTKPINQATKSALWSKLPTEPEKRTQGFSLFNGFESKGSNNRRSMVSETSLSLQVNPAAMLRSMNFRESMQP